MRKSGRICHWHTHVHPGALNELAILTRLGQTGWREIAPMFIEIRYTVGIEQRRGMPPLSQTARTLDSDYTLTGFSKQRHDLANGPNHDIDF